MVSDRFARYGAATGIVAIILILVGYSIATQDLPDIDGSADDWLSYVTDNQSDIQTGTTIVAVGLFFFIWFLGSVRSALSAAEGGTGRLTSIAYAGGIIAAAFFVIGLTAIQASAFRGGAANADVVLGLSDLATVCGAPAAAGFTAFFGATAIAGYRYGAVPAPVAGFSALAAITQPLALGVGVTDSGAFAGDGVLGLWVPIVTFSLGILTLSGALVRQAGSSAAAAPQ